MLLSNLINGMKVSNIIGNIENIDIGGICYNSLKVKKGDVFVAVKGFNVDGHKYIASAVENGAAAVVVEDVAEGLPVPQIVFEDTRSALAHLAAKYYDYPSDKFKLIGVTGTNGKTTVTYLVKTILESKGYKVGLIGTNQNMVGNMILKSDRTTPESLELQELFSIMVREGVDYVVMEVSSHSLELSRVLGCNFRVGAFTNLTQDHLDFHITMDNYVKAKSKLFSMCKDGVVNIDDEYAEKLVDGALSDIEYYGVKSDCKHRAENITYGEKGVEFDTDGCRVSLPIPGEFSVYNALCAIGICHALGIDTAACADALKSAHGVKGRAEVVNIPSEYTVMIDYAHTPDGVENIINAVKGFCKGRVITLFGCGGDRDKTKRPIMGEIAGRLSDICVVTSDNPRTENPSSIIEDVMVGVKKTNVKYEIVENRRKAIECAMGLAEKGDIVLLLGKGHETYQILNDGVIDFDERKIVTEIYEKMTK